MTETYKIQKRTFSGNGYSNHGYIVEYTTSRKYKLEAVESIHELRQNFNALLRRSREIYRGGLLVGEALESGETGWRIVLVNRY
jgi:hypothetical protein